MFETRVCIPPELEEECVLFSPARAGAEIPFARSRLATRRVRLAAQSEPCDDGAIASVVLLDQVSKKAASLSDELEEAAAGVVVLREGLEVLRKLLDPFGQERNLHLCGARVAFLGGILRNNLVLCLPRERHTILRLALCEWGFPNSLNAWRMVAGFARRCQLRAKPRDFRPRLARPQAVDFAAPGAGWTGFLPYLYRRKPNCAFAVASPTRTRLRTDSSQHSPGQNGR